MPGRYFPSLIWKPRAYSPLIANYSIPLYINEMRFNYVIELNEPKISKDPGRDAQRYIAILIIPTCRHCNGRMRSEILRHSIASSSNSSTFIGAKGGIYYGETRIGVRRNRNTREWSSIVSFAHLNISSPQLVCFLRNLLLSAFPANPSFKIV